MRERTLWVVVETKKSKIVSKVFRLTVFVNRSKSEGMKVNEAIDRVIKKEKIYCEVNGLYWDLVFSKAKKNWHLQHSQNKSMYRRIVGHEEFFTSNWRKPSSDTG